MAAELIGGVPAAWHLATSTEAADRGMAIRLSDVYCTPAPGEQITPVVVRYGSLAAPSIDNLSASLAASCAATPDGTVQLYLRASAQAH